jgi:Protein of unknown function (DUF3109)
MIQLNNILLEEDVTTVKFACDLDKCKGGCCTFPGEHGAPLLDEEVDELKNVLKIASKYLTQETLDYIDKYGVHEGVKGVYTTNCINKEDCVFVFYEDTIARCAIEKAFFNKETKFRKPISCQLFPLRVADFGGKHLFYQQFPECKPAVVKGKEENVMLYDFLKEPLVRAYGQEWYDNLCAYIKSDEKKHIAPEFWEVK